MNISPPNPLLIIILSLALTLSACSRRANDAPDPQKSATGLQKQTDNVANRAQQAVQQAETALQKSADKIDESLQKSDATD